MSVILTFSPETEQKLRERAAQSGQSVEDFLQQVLEREVLRTAAGPQSPPAGASEPPRAAKTFDEILAPIREGFAASGLTDHELEQLFEEARDEVWREKQKGSP